MNNTVQQLIQDAMNRAVDAGEVAGATMLVTQHGEERWYAQAGMADVAQGRSMARDTIFRLYSQSKPVTGTAAMMLVERGLIDLGEPVSDFLPGFKNQRVIAPAAADAAGAASGDGSADDETLTNDIPTDMAGTTGSRAGDGERTVPVNRELTVKDLLTMTSGLSYPDASHEVGRLTGRLFDELDARLHGPDPMGTIEFANRLGEIPLRFQPGSHWMYGTSADVIGAIVEVATGRRFGDFLREEIFEPLGMADTAFYVPESKLDRLSASYDNPDNPIDPAHRGRPLCEAVTDHLGIEYRGSRDPAFQSGGAGLKSTLDDYARFGQMLVNGGELDGVRILRPATVRAMTSGAMFERHIRDFADWLPGCDYNTFMRVVKEPGKSMMLCNRGEIGWDGWLGTFFTDDPSTGSTILVMMQLTNAGTVPMTRRVKNIVTSHLE
ncbi:beta-lactamase family protein [Bifidobacterium amazonense]|uniref:Beta-lactamase family protein n=1 Tax=Bifidobacterium amazonense TaxID=2809027 RepID=A0ABS9VVC8_9BIFI|nr:serine hydrolase domain-containing protein [Bifidobacterium amazonense]MCH9276039.1 beta-lactamase family protein [Bifidobacterium amazonense]